MHLCIWATKILRQGRWLRFTLKCIFFMESQFVLPIIQAIRFTSKQIFVQNLSNSLLMKAILLYIKLIQFVLKTFDILYFYDDKNSKFCPATNHNTTQLIFCLFSVHYSEKSINYSSIVPLIIILKIKSTRL